MHDIVGWAWVSAVEERIDQLHAYDCYQNVTEPHAGHRISHKKYTHV